jgi:hypothetical protein
MIHYDIPKPELSPDFTIDDIHKIREWHYEILKDATIEEQINFYREGALEFQRYAEERRREKQKAAQP